MLRASHALLRPGGRTAFYTIFIPAGLSDSAYRRAGRIGPNGVTSRRRGVAWWKGEGLERLFLGTSDARLIALDPKTGKPVPEFGEGGQIDTRQGIPRITSAETR